jgi:predicted nucleic acid-binding protein
MTPVRIFLDTNVFILGAANPDEPEGIILRWAGFETGNSEVEVVMSDEVLDQIRRVGRRLRGKDWAGELLTRYLFSALKTPVVVASPAFRG